MEAKYFTISKRGTRDGAVNEYPTKEELETIEKWDILKKPIDEFLEYVHSLWWAPDWGFSLKGKHILRLELHTGGWSGNEDIIDALHRNWLFWSQCWESSRKGGHFWFKISAGLRTVL